MSHRVAVLEKDDCHSQKCGLECIAFCPVNKMGSDCIVLGEDRKAIISEELCTGCGICVKKCPFGAITIVNLAEELAAGKIHQYGVNTFRLYRLPTLRRGCVVGIVGRNGVGKTTALNILSGTVMPNLGRYDNLPGWDEVIEAFQGTELKTHFKAIASRDFRVSVKAQAVYRIRQAWHGDAGSLLTQFDERGVKDMMIERLSLGGFVDKQVRELSGGELQRLAVAVAASRDANVYFFDEPSSYNDVFQRLAVAKVIQGLAALGKSVLLVEHDLTFLDYLSDYTHIIYGEPGVYGIVSGVHSARTGINVLLDGYLPAENVRFRDTPVTFDVFAPLSDTLETPIVADYSQLEKWYPGFCLEVAAGRLREGEVLGILGGNALGKTTFMKMIATVERPDLGEIRYSARISYKPQYLSSDYDGDVAHLLAEASGGSSSLQTAIIEPLRLAKLLDKHVADLSGGELQKVAIAACLLREAEVYALDEPSAFIDVEDRIALAKLIQRFVKSRGRSALIVDHDIQLIDIVSDALMVFRGTPGERGEALPPMPKEEGMNLFLKEMAITYRRDIESGRPRVNKPGSKLDRQQKQSGTYYYLSRTEV